MFAPSYNLTIPEEYLDNRNPEDFIALRIVGNDAYPLYHDGDVLLIDTVTEPRDGGPVVVYHAATLQLGRLQLNLNSHVLLTCNALTLDGHLRNEIDPAGLVGRNSLAQKHIGIGAGRFADNAR